ncbi:MAG: DNA-directed RNA polymerase subunit B [Thermoplasmata archaeon]
MREIVELYVKEHSIVEHQIESFNRFIATNGNPNSVMQRVVDNLQISESEIGGTIKLNTGKSSNEEIYVVFGRRNLSTKKIDYYAPQTIHIDKPIIKEAEGSKRNPTVMEARLRNLNYQSPVYLDFTIYEKGKPPRQFQKVPIGYIPIMVKSKACVLDRSNIAEQGDISDKEYHKKLIELGEDPLDTGGYFIINGTEKVLITTEDLSPNKIFTEMNEMYGVPTPVAKVFSQREGYRALTVVEKDKDNIIKVSIPGLSTSIPLIILIKALGLSSDKEVYESILTELINSTEPVIEKIKHVIYTNIEYCDNPKNFPLEGILTKEDAITFLEKKSATGQTKEDRLKRVYSLLDRSLLPHLGDTENDRIKKAYYLARMARSVLELSFNLRLPDDKDHYSNKRLKLAGNLMEDLFRSSLIALLKDMKYQLEKNYEKKRDLNINSVIRPDILTQRILHAIATGNWIGGRTGVSQLLDRVSKISTLSHLRRVSSPLTRTQPHFEARDLHPTQWGRLCPSETPEGQNCGLVKNTTIMTNISNYVDEEEVFLILKDLGMIEFKPDEIMNIKSGLARVYIDGNFVGFSAHPNELVKTIKKKRRDKTLSGKLTDKDMININARYDTKMNEIYINCDEGRLRRPLFVVEDGNLRLTEQDYNAILSGNITFSDLVDKGVIEWLDADEEDDAYIAVEPYSMPDKCPLCKNNLLYSDVRWNNIEKKDGYVELKCKHCNGLFKVDKLISKEHTHMEIEPFAILGVTAGVIPYPEHSASPRNTMGAAMTKQSLGISASNFRMRPDTREHLLHYPQKPIVSTQISKYVGLNKRPAGQNFVVAIISYMGYNMEDALIMNRSSIERALGRSTFFRTYKSEERKYPGGQEDRFEIPDAEVEGVRSSEAYTMLDEDGITSPEVDLKDGAVIIGKTSPPRFLEEMQTDIIKPKKRQETSVTLRSEEHGIVDNVILTTSENVSRLVKVKVREEKIPEIGDKFASRHGQKGVIGLTVREEDMPFTRDGITPDLVINPHAIPSRMTVAHVLEMIGGKVGSLEGRTIDGTPFSGESEELLRESLLKNGFSSTGTEVMYDGVTGKRFSAEIFIGVIYYQKLHHLVSGKMHMRARGPVQILTRQPTEGRSRQGGLRFGEMERDCLIGHGVSMVIKDRLLDESDGVMEYVCSDPKCGHIAYFDRIHKVLACRVCGNTTVYPVEMSYSFKVLIDELKSLGVVMRLEIGDLR